MKKKILVLTLIVALTSVGCETLNQGSRNGATLGGLIGAAAGGIAGHQGGHGIEGALIGGAAGALAGGLMGNSMDRKALASNPYHMTIVEIAQMTKDGVPDDVIIGEIQRTGSVYVLTSETISYLKKNNASDRLINYMLYTNV